MDNVLVPLEINSNGCSQEVFNFILASKSDNTRRAYSAVWKHYANWCERNGRSPFTPSPILIAEYLSYCANSLGRSSIQTRIAAINYAHKLKGNIVDPAIIKSVWQGIRRTKAHDPIHQKEPITLTLMRTILQAFTGSTLRDIRDKAILLIGFAGAFRRSELVNIKMEDMKLGDNGYVINLITSKTDQEGNGEIKGIPYGQSPFTCPVIALRKWLELSGIIDGAVFRRIDRHGNIYESLTDQSIAKIIKKRCGAVGIITTEIAGHSLRSGFVTTAIEHGVPTHAIMRQTGHKKEETLRRYIRLGTVFQGNAASQIGM